MTEHRTPLALMKGPLSGDWMVVRVGPDRIVADRWPLAIETQMQLDVALDKAAWLDALLDATGMTRQQLADHHGIRLRGTD